MVADYLLRDAPGGKTLVVTGAWSPDTESALLQTKAEALELNYALGFRDPSLDFLDGLPVRKLMILAPTIKDLSPVYGLAPTLEELKVQASPRAGLELGRLPRIQVLAADWEQIRDTVSSAVGLRELTIRGCLERNLAPLSMNRALAKIVLKEAPVLESLDGVSELTSLERFAVFAAPRLHALSDVASLGSKLRELEFEECSAIEALDAAAPLVGLSFLGASQCGDITSVAPIGALKELEVLHAWGDTRVLDFDLSPLMHLPRLVELRMADRREYRPRVREIQSHLPTRD